MCIYNRVGRCAAQLLCIFYLQNGGRPTSWIWHDVIADNPRLVFDFDSLNILLKLHVHRVNILRDTAIFTRSTRSIYSAVYATATWLAGWVALSMGVCHTPVLYQNG